MQSTVTLQDGMAFDVELDGHRFTIDADAQFGGQDKGPRPKGLMLSALAGCAAMDVVSILRKMRQPLESLSIDAQADLTDTHPKVFTAPITVTVTVTGAVAPDKLWRAVALSRDQYCGVSAMLKAHAPIRYVVRLNGEDVAEPTSG